MQRCTECQGKGYLQDGEPIQTSINSNTFTSKPTAMQAICPTCLGNGINSGAGT